MPTFDSASGEEVIDRIAQTQYRGNAVSAADKVLGDFRKGYLGGGSLEAPPSISRSKAIAGGEDTQEGETGHILKYDETLGVDVTKEGTRDGSTGGGGDNSGSLTTISDVGRGNYDGW